MSVVPPFSAQSAPRQKDVFDQQGAQFFCSLAAIFMAGVASFFLSHFKVSLCRPI